MPAGKQTKDERRDVKIGQTAAAPNKPQFPELLLPLGGQSPESLSLIGASF